MINVTNWFINKTSKLECMEIVNFKIKKASIFDMNEIVRMAIFYHMNDPKLQEILSNPLKSFLYKLFGPLYVRLTLIGFKMVVQGKIAGYILIKRRDHSLHIWDLVVKPEFRGKGIGKRLMEYAEKYAGDKYQYITLAVMEDNAPAIGLYEKLGYENLQFSPVCYKVERADTQERGSECVKLELILGETAIRCRSEHFFSVLKAVIGLDKSEVARFLYPLPSKIGRKTESFKISAFEREVGYMSVTQRNNLTSIFLIVDPEVWNANIEEEATMKAIESGYLKSDQIEIRVMQAYEKNLENALKKANFAAERKILRIALIKKLE